MTSVYLALMTQRRNHGKGQWLQNTGENMQYLIAMSPGKLGSSFLEVFERVVDQKQSYLLSQQFFPGVSLRQVRHVQRKASQLSGTYLPDDFSCDAWRWTCLT
jgi:hypothetical protein